MNAEKRKEYQDQIKADEPWKTGMHPAQIIIDLDDKGYGQSEFGRMIGKSQAAVNQVIHRKSSSVDIRELISDTLGKGFIEVWGMTKKESVSKRKK